MILVEDLYNPTEVKRNIVLVYQIKVSPSWMDSIILFLKEDVLPENKPEVNKVRKKAYWFWLSEDQKLYKRSFSGPYLLCIHPKAIELLLEELHEGICESHMGGRFYLTRPSHKAIGGQICKKKKKKSTGLCEKV